MIFKPYKKQIILYFLIQVLYEKYYVSVYILNTFVQHAVTPRDQSISNDVTDTTNVLFAFESAA